MMNLVTRTLLAAALLSLLCGHAMATTTWTGGAGNGDWNDANNWDNGVPSKTVTDTAVFDSATTGATITWGTGSASRPKNTNFSFLSGAHSFNFAGSDFIDNKSNTRTIQTASGMNSNQTFTSTMRVANHTITLDGAGDVTFNQLDNTDVWGDTSTNSGGWAVNNADAILTVDGFTQIRKYTLTKSGAGKLVLSGTIDFAYGMNGTTYVGSYLQTSGANAGTIDLSAATANLESHLETGENLQVGAKYTLVNYANATLIGAGTMGFASATGLPAGWTLFNDTTDKKIYLQQIPEPATLAALLAGGAMTLLRRRR